MAKNEPRVLTPSEFKAETIERNRPAFELFQAVSAFLEDIVAKDRTYMSNSDLAVDLLFVQAYKAFCSVYVVAVRGHQEDAATILRRLLEISAQIQYLEKENAAMREKRADKFLSHDPALPYTWARFKSIFESIGRLDTYEKEYSFLSRVAHASAKGGIPRRLKDGAIQIRNADFFTHLLVFACLYVLACAGVWQAHFKLANENKLNKLVTDSCTFRDDLKTKRHRGR